MKCKDVKILLMDFLYDEISNENKKLLQTHLSFCQTCREEFESLKEASHILQQSEEVESNLNLIFVSETNSIWEALKEKFSYSPKKLIYGFAIGFASILLLLSLINTEVNYENGNFSVKISLLPRQAERHEDAISEEVVVQLQQQNLQLLNTLIQQSEERQRKQLITTLSQFSRDFDNRRATDLRMVGVGMDEIEKSIYSRLEKRTNNQLNSLIRYIDTERGRNK